VREGGQNCPYTNGSAFAPRRQMKPVRREREHHPCTIAGVRTKSSRASASYQRFGTQCTPRPSARTSGHPCAGRFACPKLARAIRSSMSQRRVSERRRAEEDPREADEVERRKRRASRRERRPPGSPCRARAATSASPRAGAVEGAPDDEVPRGPVPEAAEEHRDHEVAVRLPGAAARAAERHVEIVAQPGAERDVPAVPEVLEVLARCRARRSSRGARSRRGARSDGDVGVAGEVAVDLDGVGVDGDDELERRVALGVAERAADEVDARACRR
jgi:hypothetical protein